MTCNFCGGVAHPATGCVYGPRTIACGPCVREFWVWLRRHVNASGRKTRGRSPALYFYECAGRRP
jgi:hypothetical protein